VRGEWIELLSLRSTWWALTSTAALMTPASVAYAMSLNAMAEDPETASGSEQMRGVETVASGFPFGMLVIAV
jgi:ABC-2 type transport system permease protein